MGKVTKIWRSAYKYNQWKYATIQGGPKKLAHFVLNALTSSNIYRFSNLFHWHNQENICNNIATKDPTTPQVCRYTTLWNISVLKATTENKTTSVTTHHTPAKGPFSLISHVFQKKFVADNWEWTSMFTYIHATNQTITSTITETAMNVAAGYWHKRIHTCSNACIRVWRRRLQDLPEKLKKYGGIPVFHLLQPSQYMCNH